jgi:putative transposase
MKKIRESKHRLLLDYYKGRVRATFTLCIKDKKRIFTASTIIDRFLTDLKDVEVKYECINWVYVFMPDHLHLIMEGKSDKSDLWKMIVLFKQMTGFCFSKNTPGIKWQKDFYDHIHRKDEDLKKQIRYILENPQRKKLVNDWKMYPYKGSLDFNLNEIIPW